MSETDRRDALPRPSRALQSSRVVRQLPSTRDGLSLTAARYSILCELSASDPRFPKYPALPVIQCSGYKASNLRFVFFEYPDFPRLRPVSEQCEA